jgi:hypothetical protein
MHIVVGDPDVAAIEVEVEEPRDESWLLGRFRLHALGEALGDWNDVVTLRSVLGWWRTFATDRVDRWDAQLEGLEAPDVFTVLRDAAYSEDADEELADAFGRYHVNQLGMSSFDPYVVLLVEPPEHGQWLIWRREDGADEVHDARLPAGTLQRLGAEFVSALG